LCTKKSSVWVECEEEKRGSRFKQGSLKWTCKVQKGKWIPSAPNRPTVPGLCHYYYHLHNSQKNIYLKYTRFQQVAYCLYSLYLFYMRKSLPSVWWLAWPVNPAYAIHAARLMVHEYISSLKEGPLTKNGPIDFAQSWAIHMKRKRGVASHFWSHKLHVKELILLAHSQCYGMGRKKLIWGCQGSLLKWLQYSIGGIICLKYQNKFNAKWRKTCNLDK